MNVINVAMEVLREAVHRKWFLGIALGISMVLIIMWNFLQFEIVDGALAATELFGDLMGSQIQSAEERDDDFQSRGHQSGPRPVDGRLPGFHLQA